MKNAFLILSFLFTINCFSQNEYSYYVYLSNYMNAPEFKQIESEVIYIGEDSKMKSLFNKYKILRFYQAFPNILDDKILNVYKLKTTSKELINEMISEFPSLFLSYDDLTGNYLRFLDYYPDDFGSTSPVTNLGAPVSKKDLDYINAPMAWNITMGDSNIILGISDSGIDATLQDLQHKTSFVQGYNGSGQHGTNVAAIAAAQGDNAHGTVGVCSDCSLLANRDLYGSTSDIIYNRLYQLANEGAKVINMSWTNSGYISSSSGYIQVEQDIINYIVDNFGVVFVAAAGNRSSFSSPEVHHVNNNGSPDTPFGTLFVYPATYENVISVGSVNFLHSEINSNSFVVMSPLSFPIHMYIEDSVSPQVDGTDVNNPIGIINNGFPTSSSPNGLIWMDTVNEEIDIMAPSYTIFEYYDYEHESSNGYYSGGTSYAAPAVTGAIGLMLSVNDCISVNDIETILQLTSKDIEHNLNSEDIEPSTLNEVFYGKIGSGKLEAGNAVTFVDEISKYDGHAEIKDHIFYRFNFELDNILSDLSIENVRFVQDAVVDFKAKKSIELLEGTLLEPNLNSFILLEIDSSIDLCTPINSGNKKPKKVANNEEVKIDSFYVIPTLVEADCKISKKDYLGDKISYLKVFNILGVDVFSKYNINQYEVNIGLSNLSSGLYILKLYNKNGNELMTKKIVKK